MSSSIADFVADVLRHEASDLALFERAFTHSSLSRESYERLEFLGDRVLGLTIAEALYTRFPKEAEGAMSRRYNALVARETCAEIGRGIGIPPLIRVGKQARDDQTNKSDNVVGDVVEALLGALMLDGGLDQARAFILDAWEPYISGQGRAPLHPKSALQELAAAKGFKPPVYETIGRSGAHHAPRFVVRVSVHRLGEAQAEGLSKQEAEKLAAEMLLEKVSNA